MADGRTSGLQVTPPAGSDAVAGMSVGKSEGEADETLMWDVALVFNPPYISKMPLAVASLEARGIHTRQGPTPDVLMVGVPMQMLRVEASHRGVLRGSARELAAPQHTTRRPRHRRRGGQEDATPAPSADDTGAGDSAKGTASVASGMHTPAVPSRGTDATIARQAALAASRHVHLYPSERIMATKWVLESVPSLTRRHRHRPKHAPTPGGVALADDNSSTGAAATPQPAASPARAIAAVGGALFSQIKSIQHAVAEGGELDVAVDGFVHKWESRGWLKVLPLHVEEVVDALWASCLWHVSLPVTMIRRYYGDTIALYFAWMQHFTVWLIPPAIVGALITLLGGEDSPYVAYFSLFVVLWGILFLRFWERTNNGLAYSWGTLGWVGREAINPDFQGFREISPVTGKPSLYYPRWRRTIKYGVSAVVSGVLLAGALGVMVLSINLQGYVKDTSSPLYIEWLSRFAAPGAVFDMNQWDRALFPIVLHAVVVMCINNLVYRKVAEALTRFENHHYESQAINSLILKRFAFEACNAFIILFYVAFFERDIASVRALLVSLYMTSTLRRVATESLLPLLLEWLTLRCSRSATPSLAPPTGATTVSSTDTAPAEASATAGSGSGGDVAANVAATPPKPWSVAEQKVRDEYVQFDDYLEMVIEFGYVTLFASAFPLAAAVSVVANFIEVRSDAFRIGYACQRPTPRRAASLGTWQAVLTGVVWLSVVTNCLLFAMSTTHIAHFLPWLFQEDTPASAPDASAADPQAQLPSHPNLQAAVGWAWGIEHLIIVVALTLRAMVPKHAGWLRLALARDRHEAREANSRAAQALHRSFWAPSRFGSKKALLKAARSLAPTTTTTTGGDDTRAAGASSDEDQHPAPVSPSARPQASAASAEHSGGTHSTHAHDDAGGSEGIRHRAGGKSRRQATTK